MPEAMGFTGIKGLCRHSPVWANSSKAHGQGLYDCVKTSGFKRNILSYDHYWVSQEKNKKRLLSISKIVMLIMLFET
jgi:hypothetical protein